jgi:hypothetical protein
MSNVIPFPTGLVARRLRATQPPETIADEAAEREASDANFREMRCLLDELAVDAGLEPVSAEGRRQAGLAPMDWEAWRKSSSRAIPPPGISLPTGPSGKPPRDRLYPGESESLRRIVLNAVHAFALENDVASEAVVDALEGIVERRFYRAGMKPATGDA